MNKLSFLTKKQKQLQSLIEYYNNLTSPNADDISNAFAIHQEKKDIGKQSPP